MDGERREARLRPEFSRLDPGVSPGEWKAAHGLLDVVAASRLLAGRPSAELNATSSFAAGTGSYSPPLANDRPVRAWRPTAGHC
jgi:hypothetical protein